MRFAKIAFSGWLCCVAGCGGPGGPETGRVTGVVTFDGKPFAEADIILLDPTSGRAANATLAADGSFTMSEPVAVGHYKAFLAPKAVVLAEGEAPKPVSKNKVVPVKYWNESTTDIDVAVAAGENNVTVPLLSK